MTKKARRAQHERRTDGTRGLPASERIGPIIERLGTQYPDAKCALNFSSPFELLVATILSAQSTDKRVNMVTAELFKKYKTPDDYANANPERFREDIRSTGFYRNKTRSVLGMAQNVVDNHGGQVPTTMDELVALPGVGRKTANVVLGNAFDKNVGVVVDTHVNRIANRLALTNEHDPAKIERDLMELVPQTAWTLLAHLLIHHGREICEARKPKCEICPVNEFCPSARRA